MRLRQQAVSFFLDHGVTLTPQLPQPWPVQHRNMSAVVMNDAELLHFPGRFGDALTTHAEHVSDQFLGHRQFVGRQAVQGQQQPTAQLLVYRVMAVADCSLGHLREQRLRVTQQQNLHLTVAMKLVLEFLAEQPVSITGALYDRAVRGRFAAHEQRDSNETLVSYYGDFRGRAGFHHVQKRYDRVGGKIDVAQDIARLVQNLAERHLYKLQVRIQSLARRRRQRIEQVILLGLVMP